MKVYVRLEVDVPVHIDAEEYEDTEEGDDCFTRDVQQLAWDNIGMAEVVDTGDWRPAA